MSEALEGKKPTGSSWREHLRPWFAALSLLSLLWVGWILWEAWPQAQTAMRHFDGRWLGLTLLGTTLGSYLAFEMFYGLFRLGVGPMHSKKELAHLYFVAQLMKHLPGRVWGIAYQAAQTAQASLGQWLGVNVAYMLLTMFFSVWVALVFLLYFVSAAWFSAVLVGGLSLYFALWNDRSFAALQALLARLPLIQPRQWLDELAVYARSGSAPKWRIMVAAVASWSCYYLAWGTFGHAWPGLGFLGGLQLCALYTLAWFIGYLAFVFPSGAGVRELTFLYFAKDFPPDALAAMVVFGRLVLLLADVVLGGFFVLPRFFSFGKDK